MTAVSATAARSDLYRLIDTVNEESTPITITGRRGNAVPIGLPSRRPSTCRGFPE